MPGTLLLLLAAATGQADPDPLAPARAGQLQCYTPNEAKKTCLAIAGYVLQPDGSYLHRAQVVISPAKPIAVETVTPVWVKPEGVCGRVLRSDLMAGKVMVAGQTLAAEPAAALLENLATGFSSIGMLDKTVCTTYVPDDDGLRAEVTVDGVARPDLIQHVIWIRPDEGYVLGQ